MRTVAEQLVDYLRDRGSITSSAFVATPTSPSSLHSRAAPSSSSTSDTNKWPVMRRTPTPV